MATKGTVFNFMRGGQLFFSFFAMTTGVIKKNFMLFVYVWMVVSVIGAYQFTSKEHKYYGVKWALANLNSTYLFNGDVKTEIITSSGKKQMVTWAALEKSKPLKQHWEKLKDEALYISIICALVTFFLYGGWFVVISRFGAKQSDDDFIRGGEIVTKAQHDKLVRKEEKQTKRKSEITIAGYKLPPKSDNTHFLLLGAPSVGKTATIIEYLTHIRRLGGRCIIYDRNGDFTKLFYREGVDFILNPNDARTANWTVWSEGLDQMQYRTISRALIPDVGNDPFWAQSARLVFESLCEKVAKIDRERGHNPSMEHLMTVLLKMDDEKLASILTGTDAGAVFNMNSEKMAASIRATLTTYIEPLKYMQREGGRLFSFKNWVESSSDSWIFIPVKASEIDLFKPLITVWIEQYSKAILDRASDSHKQDLRFNLVIDELASLQKLSSLNTYLSEARKFGGNAILGTQSSAQLYDIYGTKGAEILAGSIGNYVIFRNNSPEGAEWSSKLLMKEEINEVSDNLTVGHNDIRDSLNMNRNRKERTLVTASEITSLPDLEGYIRFGRGYGVLRFKQDYPQVEDIALPFVPMKKESDSVLDELDENAINEVFSHESSSPKKENFTKVDTTNYVPQYGTTSHAMKFGDNPNNETQQSGVYVGITAPSDFMSKLKKNTTSASDEGSESSEGVPNSKEHQEPKEQPEITKKEENTTEVVQQKQAEQTAQDKGDMFTRGL